MFRNSAPWKKAGAHGLPWKSRREGVLHGPAKRVGYSPCRGHLRELPMAAQLSPKKCRCIRDDLIKSILGCIYRIKIIKSSFKAKSTSEEVLFDLPLLPRAVRFHAGLCFSWQPCLPHPVHTQGPVPQLPSRSFVSPYPRSYLVCHQPTSLSCVILSPPCGFLPVSWKPGRSPRGLRGLVILAPFDALIASMGWTIQNV